MRLLWLPEVLRAAGLTVHEYSGWKTRGSADWGPVRGVTCHATAGSRTSTDAGELRTIVNGSETAPPPIAQLYLSRSGEWWVVASGRCNHNKTGWDGPNQGYGNSRLLGIEAQHSNTTAEPWPDVQYRSYVRGVAALVRRLDVPVSRVAGHKEHQPYATRPKGEGSTKSDPTFNMADFRAAVARVLAGKDDDVSAQDVVEGLEKPVDWQSAGVAKLAKSMGLSNKDFRTLLEMTWEAGVQTRTALTEVKANVAALAGKDWVNESEIVDGVLAGLGGRDLDDAVTALRAAFGDRVGELAAKLAASESRASG